MQLTITTKGKKVSKVWSISETRSLPPQCLNSTEKDFTASPEVLSSSLLDIQCLKMQDGTKDNPAVHVKRKGNDVVKRASELAVLDPQVSPPSNSLKVVPPKGCIFLNS